MLVLIAVAVTVLCLVPMGFVAVSTAGAGWSTIEKLVFRPRVGELLRNTGLLVLFSCVGTAVIGTAAAILVERMRIPGHRIWGPLLVAPLAVPAFVVGYGWVSAFPAVDGLSGATLIMSLAYYPFVYLPVAATLRGLDPAWEEQARILGLGRIAVLRRVLLPQMRPAIAGGVLLVGLHCLAEFGAFGMLRFSTFTTAIYDQYASSFASSAATMLAAVLVLACVVMLLGESAVAGRARVARVGGGVARRPTPSSSPPGGLWWGQLFLGSLVAAALGVPLTSVASWVARGSSEWPAALEAAWSTLGLAASAAVITVVVGLPVAYLAVRHRTRASVVMERMTYLSGSLPSIVVALALVTVTVRFARPAYQTALTLIAAYVLLFLPRAMVGLRSSLMQVSPGLEDAARALGSGRVTVLRRVVVPLIMPGLLAAAALVFIAVSTELTATLLLSPTGTQTLATRFWISTGEIDYVAAAPYATLMILLSAPVSFLLMRHTRQERHR